MVSGKGLGDADVRWYDGESPSGALHWYSVRGRDGATLTSPTGGQK